MPSAGDSLPEINLWQRKENSRQGRERVKTVCVCACACVYERGEEERAGEKRKKEEPTGQNS